MALRGLEAGGLHCRTCKRGAALGGDSFVASNAATLRLLRSTLHSPLLDGEVWQRWSTCTFVPVQRSQRSSRSEGWHICASACPTLQRCPTRTTTSCHGHRQRLPLTRQTAPSRRQPDPHRTTTAAASVAPAVESAAEMRRSRSRRQPTKQRLLLRHRSRCRRQLSRHRPLTATTRTTTHRHDRHQLRLSQQPTTARRSRSASQLRSPRGSRCLSLDPC